MPPRGLAAWLDTYRRDLRAALEAARADRLRLISVNAAGKLLDPAELSHSGRRHLARHVANLGLGWASLAAEFPGAGLADAARAEERLARVRTVLELCRELQVPQASVNLSGVGNESGEAVLRELAELSERIGVPVAVHDPTGHELDALAQRLAGLGQPLLRLGLDTAALPPPGSTLAKYAALAGDVYLRDVRRRGGGIEETTYGAGEVDFRAVLAALAAGGYDGALVLRRDATSAGVDALRQGREHIEPLLAWPGRS
jgi:sugar phosphate isomerase/epimerase